MSVFQFKGDFLSSLPGGIIVYQISNSRIVYANQETVKLFECDSEDDFLHYVHRSLNGMIESSDIDSALTLIKRQIIESNSFSCVCFHVVTKAGTTIFIESYGKKFIQDDIEYIAVSLFDSHLRHNSYHFDQVTGLPGTFKFIDDTQNYLKTHVFEDQFYSLVFFNFSNFKTFNMRHGMDKGDLFLCDVAMLLQRKFPNHPIARFEDDHFGVLAETTLIEIIIEEIYRELKEKYKEDNLEPKVGIYPLMKEDINQIKEALHLAKIASDYIKKTNNQIHQFYNQKIGEEKKLRDYVISHISEAVEKDWIKVYYQPVIRTISGALCGAEALARWDDPTYGLLSPGQFIDALESSRKIHILDTYVIHKVCEQMAERFERNEKVVPISFNLSRLDFYLCDIFKIIDDEVTLYQLPHDAIKVELTESIVASDAQAIKKEMQRFQEAGYAVWMDDFGTGYSSLNLLKDFSFDELKLDMAFISSFNQKSKDIISSTIKMAKKIKIQTLAEGVETFDQYDYLKHIGCEKVQGYYFGKPLPYDEMYAVLTEKGVKIEDQVYQTYYDAFTKIDFMSDSPISIIEYAHDYFNVRFANDVTLDKFAELNVHTEKDFENMLNSATYYFTKKLKEFITKPIATKKTEYIYFTYAGITYKIDIYLVAQANDHYLFTFRCHNITNNTQKTEGEAFDAVTRDISQLYDAIALLDIEKNTFTSFISYSSTKTLKIYEESDFASASSAFLKNYIYFEDQERYKNFINPKIFTKKIEESTNNYITNYFRASDQNNHYAWKEVTLLKVIREDRKKYLLLFKPVDWHQQDLSDAVLGKQSKVAIDQFSLDDKTKAKLFDVIMKNTPINYFWKDSSRRFLGASTAFLKTYGFASLEKILGKTDEDMKWHLSDDHYREDELSVLQKGTIIKDSLGKCIINGVPHTILASKWPIYANDRIEGLFGYFRDVESSAIPQELNLAILDPLTLLNNTRGFMQNLLAYSDEYYLNHRDYCLTILSFTSLERILQNYGETTYRETIKLIGSILLQICGTDCSIARLTNDKFVIAYYIDSKDDLTKYDDDLIQTFKKVHRVNDTNVTLYFNVAHSLASEHNNNPEKLYQSVLLKIEGEK